VAVAQGWSAYLEEQVRTNIFRNSVVNLISNATVMVSLAYMVALEALGGTTCDLCYPPPWRRGTSRFWRNAQRTRRAQLGARLLSRGG